MVSVRILRLAAQGLLCGSITAQQTSIALSDTQDRIEYRSYVATKAYDEVLKSWTVRLTHSGRLVGVFAADRQVAESRYVSMGLRRCIDSSDKQLVIRMWTGGKNCCNTYWIAELVPSFHLIHDGRAYYRLRDSGDGFQAADLDGDGQLEFWQDTTAFDYFRSSFADSPSVTIYFKYDKNERVYRPANAALWSVTLRRLSPLLETIKSLNLQDDASKYETEEGSDFLHSHNYRRDILTVTLAYMYAGREQEGWAFFDGQYRVRDKAEWTDAIKQRLREDLQFNKSSNQ